MHVKWNKHVPDFIIYHFFHDLQHNPVWQFTFSWPPHFMISILWLQERQISLSKHLILNLYMPQGNISF